jgi:cutinase
MPSNTGSIATSAGRFLGKLAPVIVAAAAMIGPQAAGVAAAAPTPACADVEVVFARGTFEAPGVGDTGQAFVNALDSRLAGKSVEVYPVNYPASLDFQAAANGVVDASNKINAVAASCPDTDIVLGGYSQGAAVAGYTTFDAVPAGLALPAGLGPMPPAVAQHVSAVVLFGTPDNWFLNLVDRGAPPITIGQLYSAKTLQLCAPGDPVCSPGGLDRAAHSSYKSNGMADQAADFAARAIGASPSAAV